MSDEKPVQLIGGFEPYVSRWADSEHSYGKGAYFIAAKGFSSTYMSDDGKWYHHPQQWPTAEAAQAVIDRLLVDEPARYELQQLRDVVSRVPEIMNRLQKYKLKLVDSQDFSGAAAIKDAMQLLKPLERI